MPEAKKEKGLDREVKHLGVFTNFRNIQYEAYLVWEDDGETRRGFALRSVKDDREFKPGLLVIGLAQLATARVKFSPSGKTEPVKGKK